MSPWVSLGHCLSIPPGSALEVHLAEVYHSLELSIDAGCREPYGFECCLITSTLGFDLQIYE